MPIQFPPALLQDAQDRKARLQAQATQFQNAATQKQGEIDGTAGAPPGLQAEEDVQLDLWNQYETAVGYFESERKALDGVFPNPIVTETIIQDSAAGVRPTLIFPVPPPMGESGLSPVYVNGLKGLGGADPNNENARKTTELANIATLLGLTPINRPTSGAYTSWIASLTAQSALLATQIAAIAANETYGVSHPAYTASVAEKAAVDALLPTPATDNATLTARQTQASLRQGTIAGRVTQIVADVTPFHDQRFVVLQGRVSMGQGTLTRLRSAEKSLDVLAEFTALNTDQIALYTALGA
jgi:hypothetical protein